VAELEECAPVRDDRGQVQVPPTPVLQQGRESHQSSNDLLIVGNAEVIQYSAAIGAWTNCATEISAWANASRMRSSRPFMATGMVHHSASRSPRHLALAASPRLRSDMAISRRNDVDRAPIHAATLTTLLSE